VAVCGKNGGKCVFCREISAKKCGIHWRNVIPPGITSSWNRNPPRESGSAESFHLMNAVSVWQDQNGRKILQTVTILGISTPNPLYYKSQHFLTFTFENVLKIKTKPYPALLQASFISGEIKKSTKIS
jgi:hypothetical protein